MAPLTRAVLCKQSPERDVIADRLKLRAFSLSTPLQTASCFGSREYSSRILIDLAIVLGHSPQIMPLALLIMGGLRFLPAQINDILTFCAG